MRIRNVLSTQGGNHLEQQIGNIRYNMSTGETSYLLGQPWGAGSMQTRTVMDNDGVHLEQQVGNMRWNMSTGEQEWLL